MNARYILEGALADALNADWRLSKWSQAVRGEISTAASLDYLERLGALADIMQSFPLLGADGTPACPQPAPRIGETWIPRREEIRAFARIAANLARKNHGNHAGYRADVDVERVGIATPGVSSIGVRAVACSFRIEGRMDSRHATSDHGGEPDSFDIRADRYLGRPVHGKEPPLGWRDGYFEGRKPKAYRPPTAKDIVDDGIRECVRAVEAEKIAIAERPAATRRTGGRC